jgi:hypothetical protein
MIVKDKTQHDAHADRVSLEERAEQSVKQGTPPAEPAPQEILERNLDNPCDKETIINSAMAKYGDDMISSGVLGYAKRHNFAILSLLCDYYEYRNPQRFGNEFGAYYERHLRGTATPRDSMRNMLKAHFARNGSH